MVMRSWWQATRARDRVTLVILLPGVLVGGFYGVVGLYAMFIARRASEDPLIAAVSWPAAMALVALIVRACWSLYAPERRFPRWLAVTVLTVVGITGLAIWLFMTWAASFGP
ncbi:MAG: hypothetical protein HKN62_09080 [Phycisphaerales bacterium]|nr:hypothetical protein [Phycisphaerales bacterium]